MKPRNSSGTHSTGARRIWLTEISPVLSSEPVDSQVRPYGARRPGAPEPQAPSARIAQWGAPRLRPKGPDRGSGRATAPDCAEEARPRPPSGRWANRTNAPRGAPGRSSSRGQHVASRQGARADRSHLDIRRLAAASGVGDRQAFLLEASPATLRDKAPAAPHRRAGRWLPDVEVCTHPAGLQRDRGGLPARDPNRVDVIGVLLDVEARPDDLPSCADGGAVDRVGSPNARSPI